MLIAKKLVGESSITFAWADETSSEISLSQFSDEIIQRAALHGLSQKLGDSYSGAEGSIPTAKAAFDDTLAALEAGDWNRKGGVTGGAIVEAVARAAGVSIEEALAKWMEMDEEVKKATRAHPTVKAAKAEIDLERAQARIKATDAEPLEL